MTVAFSGDFGKPRPALVIQSNGYPDTATLTVLLVSSTLVEAPLVRITVTPTQGNGLRATSQIMIDKAMTAPRDKFRPPFGRLDSLTLQIVDRALAKFLELE